MTENLASLRCPPTIMDCKPHRQGVVSISPTRWQTPWYLRSFVMTAVLRDRYTDNSELAIRAQEWRQRN
jgi:hypothetical protein